ncbi:MAG: patatin-like phospholipase family protein [Actinomycetota bacterium]
MTVGIVLGAGGPLGWAFHLGVIEGMREVLGVEPADADRIIGTSAGGAIAASLLSGATSDEVLASISAPMSDDDQAQMRGAFADVRSSKLRALKPLAPGLALTPWRRAPLVSAAGLLPAGVFPTFPLRRFPIGAIDGWPESLWIPSVRMDTGQLTVFGRDRRDIAVADALEATSAVPGMFRPKQIDGVAHVDGAVASATHADLLLTDRPDRVLVSSVMSRPGRRLGRIRARRQLAAEVAALRAAGTHVAVVEPDEALMALAEGFPRRNMQAGADIVAAARDTTIAALRPFRPVG